MICKPTCINGSIQNDWVNNCNLTLRKGGIPRMIFLKCNPSLVLPNGGGYESLDNWKWLLCNGHVYVTGKVLGSSPKKTVTKKRTSSCAPEKVVSGQKTVVWQDYNASVDDLLDYDFYAFIEENKEFLKFGWISCDERVSLFGGDWDLDGDYVEEPTQDDNTFYDAVVTMSTVNTIAPIKVPGILALLDGFANATTCYT